MEAKQSMLFFILVIFVSLACMTFPALAQEKEAHKANVATVNGTPISQGDFDKELNVVRKRITGMGKTLNEDQLKSLKTDVLERLINRELLFQKSQDNGIKVEEAAVNEQLDALKKSFANEEEFKKALLDMNFSEDYLTSQIRRDLAIKKFVDKQFAEKATVSDKEVKDYYDGHPDAFKKPEQVKASHILIKVDPQADESAKAAARKKVDGIQQRVKKGEDFASLAKEFSECPSSAQGGDLGFFGRGQMVKPFEDAAFALAPGEVSNIVETRFGYHLIKSSEKRPQTTISYEEVKEKLQEHLKQNKVQEQINAYVEELKKAAKVERL